MQIQLNTHHVERTDELEQFVDRTLNEALEHLADRLTRVEVHLTDENGPKGGPDKTCKMEGRIAGKDPVTVEQRFDNIHGAIREASGKLKRAVRSRVEK